MRKKIGKIVSCEYCHIKFHQSPNKLERQNHHFCSRKHYLFYRWGTEKRIVPTKCEYCGKTTKHKEWKRFRDRPLSFCNHICYGKWRTKTLSGNNSPNWKGGINKYLKGSWRHRRKDALLRDNYTCQICGINKQEHGYLLDVHHIIPYDSFANPFEANKLNNLKTLCRKCHFKIENNTIFLHI